MICEKKTPVGIYLQKNWTRGRVRPRVRPGAGRMVGRREGMMSLDTRRVTIAELTATPDLQSAFCRSVYLEPGGATLPPLQGEGGAV